MNPDKRNSQWLRFLTFVRNYGYASTLKEASFLWRFFNTYTEYLAMMDAKQWFAQNEPNIEDTLGQDLHKAPEHQPPQ